MPLKRVLMFKTVYFRAEGLPIVWRPVVGGSTVRQPSRPDDPAALELLELLFSKGLINRIGLNEDEAGTFESIYDGYKGRPKAEFIERRDSYNYASEISMRWEEINRAKWKSKNGITKMLNMPKLTIEKWNEINLGAIEEFCEAWNNYRLENYGEGSVRRRSLIKDILKYHNQRSMLNWVFLYDDKQVGIVCYIKATGQEACHQIINRTLPKTNIKVEGDELEFINKHIGRFIYYKSIEYFNQKMYRYLYVAGVHPSGNTTKMKYDGSYKKILNPIEIPNLYYRLK